MEAILIAGGSNDPNLHRLIQRAAEKRREVIPFLVGDKDNHGFHWNMSSREFSINGKRLAVAAAFIRRDVFHRAGQDADYRSLTWFQCLSGWLSTQTSVSTLNRRYLDKYTNKLQVLHLATQCGLAIPETTISNLESVLRSEGRQKRIAKPVNGGGYCQTIAELLPETTFRENLTACPAIIQTRISGQDLRIYRIGRTFLGFKISSDTLDYRRARQRKIEVASCLPDDTIQKLGQLMDVMGLDWGAADFKVCEKTGNLVFLEVNSNPMFSVFDRIGEGNISEAILNNLCYL